MIVIATATGIFTYSLKRLTWWLRYQYVSAFCLYHEVRIANARASIAYHRRHKQLPIYGAFYGRMMRESFDAVGLSHIELIRLKLERPK